ncbi:hypothetical protein WMY93_023156 [Mugilogobius chulae]|uniref:Zinc finger protein 143 n=1 Tax=Mugilogobius chulae TaxID=88201 RepID=A0AAW0N3I7_9GOBI
MLLAQINRGDAQGMAEFQDADGQPVTLCLTETVTVADGDQMEAVDTVSLQAVTLSDGSTAYIQHESKPFPEAQIMDGQVIHFQHESKPFSEPHLMDGQVIQLEVGSAAYVQHLSVPKTGGESLQLEDGQAVQLEDGTTAYIHTPKGNVMCVSPHSHMNSGFTGERRELAAGGAIISTRPSLWWRHRQVEQQHLGKEESGRAGNSTAPKSLP